MLLTNNHQFIIPEPSTFDSVLEKALLYVCANALVCDTLEIARKLCFEHGEKIKGKTNICIQTTNY